MTNNERTILDVKYGNISNMYSKDKVVLNGIYYSKDSSFADDIKITLNREDDIPISISFPYSGYNMQLFIGDFTGDNKSEIMVRGAFGGSGGFEIGVVYKYEDNKLIKIFDQNTFAKDYPCTASFKPNYKVAVRCSNKKYLIDISSRPDDYLDYIYTSDGSVKPVSPPYVDSPNGIYPIKQVYNNYYQLLITQRIVGIANADTIGTIQTLGDLLDSKFNLTYRALLLPPSSSNNISIAKKRTP